MPNSTFTKKPTFMEMFSGAGGLGLGISDAGFNNVLSLDNDRDSLKTLSGHCKGEIIHDDAYNFISSIEGNKRKLPNIDLLVGGPPCQGFCSINPNRREDDPRNSLIDCFLHSVALVKPKAVLIENVTGLLSLGGGFAIIKIEKRLRQLGFKTTYMVLQAAHYGIPQSRWRLFIVGYKKGTFRFPEPTHNVNIVPNFVRGKELTFNLKENDLFSPDKKLVTVWEAISDLPRLKNGESYKNDLYPGKAESDYQKDIRRGSLCLTNHETKTLKPITLKRVRAISKEGMNWRDLPESLIPDNLKKLRKKYGAGMGSKTRFARLRKESFFSTIVTSAHPYWGAFIHPNQDRVLSVREFARAQSFPDIIEISGGLVSKYRQIGNAVPPLLAKKLGVQLQEVV